MTLISTSLFFNNIIFLLKKTLFYFFYYNIWIEKNKTSNLLLHKILM